MRPSVMAARRRIAAARFADGWCPTAEEASAGDLVVRREREPGREVFLGGPPRHVGPDLGEESERVVGADAIDLRQVDAGELVQRRAEIEARFVLARLVAAARGRQRGRRGRGRGGELGEVRLDRGIARGELLLIDVEEFEVLLQHEDVFGAVVAGERGDDLGLGRAAAIIAMRASCCGSRWPATMSRRMRRPVTPVMSLTTSGSWRFIWTNAFCMRWTSLPALSMRVARCRRYPRKATMPSAGRKLPRSRPRMWRSRSHSQSETSLLRPGRFFTWRALTRITWKPRASRISKIGIQ